jgi:hypothetical protein
MIATPGRATKHSTRERQSKRKEERGGEDPKL